MPTTKQTASSQPQASTEESELCISCLQTNVPGTNFCRHCGTPLTSYAATGPFESIFAEGDFWRKAMARAKGRTPRRILLWLAVLLIALSIVFGLLLPR